MLPPENVHSVGKVWNRKPQDAHIAAAISEGFRIACGVPAVQK
jgi:hypothetical protein